MNNACSGLFNIRNLVSSLILIFVRICLCDTILYTSIGKKWKLWGWKICLVYAYFCKHLSLSMLISFMLINKKECTFSWNIASKTSKTTVNPRHLNDQRYMIRLAVKPKIIESLSAPKNISSIRQIILEINLILDCRAHFSPRPPNIFQWTCKRSGYFVLFQRYLPRALWPIFQEPDFSQILNLNFHYRPDSENNNDQIFQ